MKQFGLAKKMKIRKPLILCALIFVGCVPKNKFEPTTKVLSNKYLSVEYFTSWHIFEKADDSAYVLKLTDENEHFKYDTYFRIGLDSAKARTQFDSVFDIAKKTSSRFEVTNINFFESDGLRGNQLHLFDSIGVSHVLSLGYGNCEPEKLGILAAIEFKDGYSREEYNRAKKVGQSLTLSCLENRRVDIPNETRK